MQVKRIIPINLFFLLIPSVWPFYVGLSSFSIIISFVFFFKTSSINLILINFFFLVVICFSWWKEIRHETYRGNHTFLSVDNLKIGIILFIFREICFFAGFFWRFFHYSFIPATDFGNIWPPYFLQAINPFSVPFLNTIVLLRRGATVTLSHIKILNNNNRLFFLFFTLILGIYFTFLQIFEYYMASFSIIDSVFGSIFFISTGFHGIHVIVGSIFLFICFIRIVFFHFSSFNHLGFEMAIWYWHFVDVVWLFLFSFIYWWGF